jgi:hypothetical protein
MAMVEQIWRRMFREKILPSKWPLTVMMQYFAQTGNISRMLECFEQIPDQQRDSQVFAILIDG